MADDSHPTYSPDHFPSLPEDDPVEIAKKLGKVKKKSVPLNALVILIIKSEIWLENPKFSICY